MSMEEIGLFNIHVRVRAFMKTKMVTVDVGSKVRDAVKRMVEAEVGSIVVTRKGEPIGIITERDVLRRVAFAQASLSKPVEDIMSGPLVTVDSLATLAEAGEVMAQKKIRRLLVKEGDKIVGIITERDLQNAFLDTFRALLLT
jgi:CBS domain-containing protein